MASPQDISVEPSVNPHRLSATGTPTSSMARRNSVSRSHGHSVSLGTFNPDHRVTRRKSINSSAVSSAGAIRAAMNLETEGTTSRASHRRSLPAKGNRNSQGFSAAMDGSKNGTYTYAESVGPADESAVADDMGPSQLNGGMSKARARRASEGSHLSGGKRASGELRCEKCGKGYKHSSCLTKHLWEHTPEWALTSKLLVSKHQQVQILEAASVLVGMNQEGIAETDMVKPSDSDNNSSASPAASGSSGLREDEGYSSAETTPPPMSDHYGMLDGVNSSRASKRYSGNSSSFSRSYQSAPSSSLPGNGFAGPNSSAVQRRPSSSGLGRATDDEDEAGLIAAVQSLCSFGTPRSGAVLLPADVPPVPPLPARFIEQSYLQQPSYHGDKSALDLSRQATVVPEGHVHSSDVAMSNAYDATAYRSDDRTYRFGSEEAAAAEEDSDDGVFGGMEGLAHEAHQTLNSTRAS